MIEAPSVIDTDRFVLRPLRAGEGAAELRRWFADPRVAAGLARAPLDLGDTGAANFIAGFDGCVSHLLGIFRRDNQVMVGFWTIQLDHRHLTATLSLILGETGELHRQAGRETGLALLGWTLEVSGAEKVIFNVAETNELVAKWLSPHYRLEGRLVDEVRNQDGSRLTILRFGLLKSEWPAIRERRLAYLAKRLEESLG